MSEASKLRDQVKSLQHQLNDFEYLSSVFKVLSSTIDIEGLLDIIVSESIKLCHASQGSILLFDPSENEIAKTLIKRGETKEEKINPVLNHLLAGWILEHKRTLQTDKVSDYIKLKQFKEKYRDIRSVLCVPLTDEKGIMGVVNLISTDKSHLFSRREATLLESLATQCVHVIRNARVHEELFKQTEQLRMELKSKYDEQGIIGKSPRMREVYSLLERILPTDARVLIEGESGTGKELIARMLHYHGPHKSGPFVAIDCGAFPENLLESELFGYVKGAFTGAVNDKPGLFEEAEGGTLFLDEITNMPLAVQSKLLRALQEEEIRPVGSTKVKKVSVRILTAASDNCKESVEQGKLREDLYYRLDVVSITLPPLRERTEDIPILVQHFIDKMAGKYNKNIKGLINDTLILMEKYSWPGNIRQLENIIERMIILANPDCDFLGTDLLPPELMENKEKQEIDDTAWVQKKVYDKQVLKNILEKNNWNRSLTARELGIPESTLRFRLNKMGLKNI